MKKNEKILEREENVSAKKTMDDIPNLKRYFESIEKTVSGLSSRYKERARLLLEMRDEMLKTLQTLTAKEIKIIYYLRTIDGVSVWEAFQFLRTLSGRACAFKNDVLGEEKYYDVMRSVP